MKAALLEKPYQFVIKEIAEPKIKKSWVKIQKAHEMLLSKDVESVKIVLRYENAE